ncbi:unnamed protein product [Closterium sp. Naga37s-1]|nr:unnamed protein product [Closterium sp. Naga37s-1]
MQQSASKTPDLARCDIRRTVLPPTASTLKNVSHSHDVTPAHASAAPACRSPPETESSREPVHASPPQPPGIPSCGSQRPLADIVFTIAGLGIAATIATVTVVGGGATLLFFSPVLLFFSPILVPLLLLGGGALALATAAVATIATLVWGWNYFRGKQPYGSEQVDRLTGEVKSAAGYVTHKVADTARSMGETGYGTARDTAGTAYGAARDTVTGSAGQAYGGARNTAAQAVGGAGTKPTSAAA